MWTLGRFRLQLAAWLLLVLVSLLACGTSRGQRASCTPSTRVRPWQNFAVLLDAECFFPSAGSASSLVEYTVYGSRSMSRPGWLRLRQGSDLSSSQLQLPGYRNYTRTAILYGTPTNADAGTVLSLQVEALNTRTFELSTSTLNLTVLESTGVLNRSRLLYPQLELTPDFVSMAYAAQLIASLSAQYSASFVVVELTTPQEYGTILRDSVFAADGLYVTVGTSSGSAASALTAAGPCTSASSRTIGAGGPGQLFAFCFEAEIAQAQPVVGQLIQSAADEERYVAITFSPERRDRLDDFLRTVLPGAVCAFLVAVVMLYLFIFGRTSLSKREAYVVNGNGDVVSTEYGSRHRGIHGATVRLRHLPTTASRGQQEFHNPIYDRHADVLSANAYTTIYPQGSAWFENAEYFVNNNSAAGEDDPAYASVRISQAMQSTRSTGYASSRLDPVYDNLPPTRRYISTTSSISLDDELPGVGQLAASRQDSERTLPYGMVAARRDSGGVTPTRRSPLPSPADDSSSGSETISASVFTGSVATAHEPFNRAAVGARDPPAYRPPPVMGIPELAQTGPSPSARASSRMSAESGRSRLKSELETKIDELIDEISEIEQPGGVHLHAEAGIDGPSVAWAGSTYDRDSSISPPFMSAANH